MASVELWDILLMAVKRTSAAVGGDGVQRGSGSATTVVFN